MANKRNDVTTDADVARSVKQARVQDAKILAELAERHQNKKDTKFGDSNPSGVEPASGESTRANRQPGVLPPGANKLPASSAGVHHNKPETDVHGGDFSLGAQGRKRPASQQVEQVKERPVERLQETKRRQFNNGN